MKPVIKYKPKGQIDSKYEIINLHRENKSLRNQLKEIGNKLNEIIEKKNARKKENNVKDTHQEELREANKIIEMYK
jgi:UDP-N-acetylglucosamine 2-epimerase